ncbi:MAG: hypothetical protein HGB30_01395 [Holophagaceae bacterium]|nr:hypothetical protein [Holophagaceae bacterium]
MLTGPLVLLLELPPLAFGPPLPLRAVAPPREFTCAVGELGRPRALKLPPAPGPRSYAVDPSALHPGAPLRHLVNPVVDGLLVLGALAATHGGWDERSWTLRSWGNVGGVTPVLIPPMAPPQSR